MFPASSGGYSFTAALADEQATRRLMVDIACAIEPGDLITLSGDLGAGKTTFARVLIRYLAGDETVEVPSPTFTLMQSYELPRFTLIHADLYRLSGPSELAELGFEDLSAGAVTLLEWPDRAAGVLPPDRFDIAFTLAAAWPDLSQRARHRLRQVRGAGGAYWHHPPLPRPQRLRHGRAAAHPGRRLHPLLRAPHTRGHELHPDERAEAAGRPARARRQAV
jgi:tRNA threonylcarbamoyl adenosine modification protein YjeE